MAKKRILTQDEIDRYKNNSDELREDGLEYFVVPSHLNACGNEIADGLAREGRRKDSTHVGCLTFSKITTWVKQDISFFWWLVSYHEWTATAGSDVVQSGRPIFDDFFQHLWPYIGNNTANVVFQMVKRLWLIRIDQ
ncbi:hypothetical protein TNCV_765801 [Trichonephila clavipes]|nr:hypothetical protein TNCV_765801 [Trichonephila clavipes]